MYCFRSKAGSPAAGLERFLQLESLRRGNPSAARRRILLALRIAALIFGALTLAGVPLPIPDRGDNVVVVTGPDLEGGPNAARPQNRIAALSGGDRLTSRTRKLGVVRIGAQSRIVRDLGDGTRAASALPASQTIAAADLRSALATAAAMLPADAPGQIVVLSDGNETRGNAARALPQVARRGFKVDVLPLSELTGGEVLIEGVTTPERIYAGDTFPLEAVIYSQKPHQGDDTRSQGRRGRHGAAD